MNDIYFFEPFVVFNGTVDNNGIPATHFNITTQPPYYELYNYGSLFMSGDAVFNNIEFTYNSVPIYSSSAYDLYLNMTNCVVRNGNNNGYYVAYGFDFYYGGYVNFLSLLIFVF
jgi:hypothetical protein